MLLRPNENFRSRSPVLFLPTIRLSYIAGWITTHSEAIHSVAERPPHNSGTALQVETSCGRLRQEISRAAQLEGIQDSQSKWNLIRRLVSRLVKGIVSFIDGLSGLRGFSRFCSVSFPWHPIQNLHLVGHDFGYRTLFAFRACPLPSLQPAFQVNVPALIQVFSADLRQAGEADDLKPLHPFPGSACWFLSPLVDRKAEGTDRLALLAEFKFRGIAQEPD